MVLKFEALSPCVIQLRANFPNGESNNFHIQSILLGLGHPNLLGLGHTTLLGLGLQTILGMGLTTLL